MDFHALLAKMQELDRAPVVDQPAVEGCGDPMPPMPSPMAPPVSQEPPPAPHPSMSVNLNAQGLDNIEQMMKLFQKVNPDMMPKVAPAPMLTPMPSISSIKPELPPLKMLPDFDADNDSKVGGEMDIEIDPMDKMDLDKDPMDLDKDPMDLDKDMGSQPGKLGGSLDRDGDGDHDMDDHDMEKDSDDGDNDSDDEKKKEAWENEPNEEEKDVDYMLNKLSGGMNSNHGTYPKVADGDNPMQKVKESNDELRASIRAELQRRLNEAKGAK
jgi:hypothetical protein